MGYYTRYSLEIEGEDDNILELPGEESLGDRIMGELIDGEVEIYRLLEDSCKWYEHEADMKALSLKYPGVVFHLRGEGEESGDLWEKDFWRGQMQKRVAKIVFDLFDPTFGGLRTKGNK